MIDLEDLFQIFTNVDHKNSTAGRLEELKHTLTSICAVQHLSIICFNPLIISKIHAIPDFVYTVPPDKSSGLPDGPAVITSHSSILKDVLPARLLEKRVLYYPFTAGREGPGGALLFLCTHPRHFLASNRRQLGILASKIRDTLQLGAVSKEGARNRPNSEKNGDLTPEILKEVMDLIDLPMYIMDRKRIFISVNSRFLRQYHFTDLEEINRKEVFFFETNQFTRVSTPDHFTTFRNGRNETIIVRDASTQVGKYIFGILFDITDHIKINEELKETIEAQKLLNEKLVTTTSILQKTQSTAMKSLAKLAEYRDMETGNHLHRICEFNRCICKKVYRSQPYSFSISEDYIDDIFLSGMLHDIGKVGVPDQILLKPGSLNPKEWRIMKKHTEWGWNILHEADEELGEQSFLTLASPIALSHHERYDGTGYPKNLVGEAIPLSARISSLSDVYDALTSHRPYKQAWEHSQAMEEIVSMKGKQFDPVLVEIAEDIEDEFLFIKKAFPDQKPDPDLVH